MNFVSFPQLQMAVSFDVRAVGDRSPQEVHGFVGRDPFNTILLLLIQRRRDKFNAEAVGVWDTSRHRQGSVGTIGQKICLERTHAHTFFGTGRSTLGGFTPENFDMPSVHFYLWLISMIHAL